MAGPRPGSARPPRARLPTGAPQSMGSPDRGAPARPCAARVATSATHPGSVIAVLDPAPSVVRGPADLLTTIPYLLGYHPADSVVVMFVAGDGRLVCGLSVGREAPDEFIIAKSSTAAARADCRHAFVVGYGPLSDRERIGGIADALNLAVTVAGRLLVDDGRYYCLTDGCPCTPGHGAVLDPSSNVIA